LFPVAVLHRDKTRKQQKKPKKSIKTIQKLRKKPMHARQACTPLFFDACMSRLDSHPESAKNYQKQE
jgi:hypothetical protein